jgi:hypothetical protein
MITLDWQESEHDEFCEDYSEREWYANYDQFGAYIYELDKEFAKFEGYPAFWCSVSCGNKWVALDRFETFDECAKYCLDVIEGNTGLDDEN